VSEALQSLFVMGLSHHKAPLEVRESFALKNGDLPKALRNLQSMNGLLESMVLSTCNRLEVYGFAENKDSLTRVGRHFCEANHFDPELFEKHSYIHTNLSTLQHFVGVTAGLDSQMVGETDIQNQVKSAYDLARTSGSTGPVLNRLFERGFHAAKKARTSTGISKGNVSVGNVCVDLAERIFGKLSRSRVLLIGSGEVAELTAQALLSRGAADITVTSRSQENALALASNFGGAVLGYSDFLSHLSKFDIVISSTASKEIILNRECISGNLSSRRGRPLFLIDLAVPRDVAPEVDSLYNVFVYNLDDIARIANENLEHRRQEIEQAKLILDRQSWSIWLDVRRRYLLKSIAST